MSGLLALIIDRLWGEPAAALHPVVWMGRYLQRLGKNLPARRPAVAFILGAAGWLTGAILVGALYAGAELLISRIPVWLAPIVLALCLKPLLALRVLLEEVGGVESALATGLAAGRSRLARIVSRDTGLLDASQVRESALESLAENLSDSVVAPLFWFALLGLPGAAVYRFANTADAMWGYRDQREWSGKFAARADDVLNLIPARLTAVALLLAFAARPPLWCLLPREAAQTQSPNSGWPMAALALALGVRLSKPGVYVLNSQGCKPSTQDVAVALRQVRWTAWGVAAGFAALAPLRPLLLLRPSWLYG